MLKDPVVTPKFANAAAQAWPAKWISLQHPRDASFVAAYRLNLALQDHADLRLHVTADQRYRLFVDGRGLGNGPERGSPLSWHYESYDVSLAPGNHTIVALVWTHELKPGMIPGAQMTMRHGFLLAADSPWTDRLATGSAQWSVKQLTGVTFALSGLSGAGLDSGPITGIDGASFPWGIERGEGEGWETPEVLVPGRSSFFRDNWGLLQMPRLVPAALPPQLSRFHPFTRVRHVGALSGDEPLVVTAAAQAEDNAALAAGNGEWRIGANRHIWVLVDLDEYYCGYPELIAASGRGSRIQVLWAESLFHQTDGDGDKGNRDEIEGKLFTGRGDRFVLGDCSRDEFYTSFWWNCGRYVAIVIKTADEPLVLKQLGFRETRYPYTFDAPPSLAHEGFMRSRRLMTRVLQMCAHETFMDCPYYEQLNYVGDTRVQALTSYVLTWDDRLPVKCIDLFRQSLLPTGLTQSRFPANVIQVIPQFSLYWVDMLHDLALWRGHRERIREALPAARCVIDTFLNHIGDDGLLHCPEGWDWIDWAWTSSLKKGLHPVGPEGASATNHLQLIHTLGHAAKLENWAGLHTRAEQYTRLREELWARALDVFWDQPAGLFAATSAHNSFGEHAQCYAVLSGLLDGEKAERMRHALRTGADLDRATFYFRFYLFAAFDGLGMHQDILEGFNAWGAMADIGLRTTGERPEPTRSDCHAWSAHPLYHAVVSLGGIRPTAFGFESVTLAPAIHAVPSAAITAPHRLGQIQVAWEPAGANTLLKINIPDGLEARLELPGQQTPVPPGRSEWEIPASHTHSL